MKYKIQKRNYFFLVKTRFIYNLFPIDSHIVYYKGNVVIFREKEKKVKTNNFLSSYLALRVIIGVLYWYKIGIFEKG